jgi:hypothetical protein
VLTLPFRRPNCQDKNHFVFIGGEVEVSLANNINTKKENTSMIESEVKSLPSKNNLFNQLLPRESSRHGNFERERIEDKIY